MRTEQTRSISSEQPLTKEERLELEQLKADTPVQTYLRLTSARASAPFLNMPGIDLQAAQAAQSAAMSGEINKLLAQDSQVGIRAERFLALQRRAELS